MKTSAIAVVLLLTVALASPAGRNPHVRAYITVDPDEYVHCYPAAASGTIVNTYLCFDCVNYPISDAGLSGVSLVLDYQCGGFAAGPADVTLFHPDAETVSGGPDDLEDGWVITAPECVRPDESGIVCVALIPWFYMSPPGEILILPHPVDGKAVVDCNGYMDSFCVLSHGALGQELETWGDPDCDCDFPFTEVLCEPQGGEYPNHPPTYWYLASPGYAQFLDGFHVQTFDPNLENYTNWVDPYGWTHADSIAFYDGSYWVTWYDTLCSNTPELGYRLFQFDNPNLASWGHWTMTVGCDGNAYDPFEGMSHSSWGASGEPDGHGYRVHVPTAGTPAEKTSWGAIKALYR